MRKNEKDIFRQFREKRDLIQERPSQRVWNRLENRLDKHYGREKHTTFRFLSLAAAILVLVVVITMLSISINKENQHTIALYQQPRQLEELPILENNEEALMVVVFMHQYQDKAIQPKKEGKVGKKLVPAINK